MKFRFKQNFMKKIDGLNIEYRALSAQDKSIDSSEQIGLEGAGSIIRLCENSNNPLDIYLTTKGNYKVYDKKGNLVKHIDGKYLTESDFINFLKSY